MEKETSKNKIYFLVGVVITLLFVIIANFITSKANYRKTESIPLAKGTINYKIPDLNVLAMYKEKDNYTSVNDKYEQITEVPNDNYKLSDKSYCGLNNEKEETIKIEYKDNLINVLGLTKKGTKCYIYFDKLTAEDTLAKFEEAIGEKFTTEAAPASYNGIDTEDHGNLLYYTEDNDGVSYFYRGAAKNNWVKFGTNDDNTKDIWWRIIRINGDGTIRLIYTGMYETGTAPQPGDKAYVTGEETLVATNQEYRGNELYNDNSFVGYYYGDPGGEYPDNHSNAHQSNVATQIYSWYNGDNWNAEKYEQYIDENAGFCNDRTIHPTAKTWWTSEGETGRGSGNVVTAYGSFSRIMTDTADWQNSQTPTLICGKDPIKKVNKADYKRDLYTPKNANKGNGKLEVPVGLITVDEAIYAGGFGNKYNTDYFLYNNQDFWTMSPICMNTNNHAIMFSMDDKGNLDWDFVSDVRGVRPVINLKANTIFTTNSDDDKGTYSNPYIVKTN